MYDNGRNHSRHKLVKTLSFVLKQYYAVQKILVLVKKCFIFKYKLVLQLR